MTGSIAIDVVIGLVFIFTLYSLLTTTVVELIATAFRLRATFLERGIVRMLDDGTKNKIFSEKFFDQPLIKYLGSGGLWGLVKKPSYLSAQNFSKAVLEVLKEEGKNHVLDPVQRTPVLNIQTVLYDDPKFTDKQTVKFIRTLLEDSQNDLDKFRTYLEQWYDDTMERVSSWYKNWIQVITFVVGFIIAMGFNVDTIQITRRLSLDPKAREQYVVMAQKLAENDDLASKVYGSQSYDTLRNVLSELNNQALKANDVISIKEPGSLLGWLITAFALSLGAPFWFDLLNKLVKLRGSIKASSESDASRGEGSASKGSVPNTKRVG